MTIRRPLPAAALAAALATLAACAHKPEAPLDRSRLPPAGAPRGIDLPTTGSFELPNGVRVVHVERADLPLVTMRLILKDAGSASDPAELAGLSTMTMDLLDEGAGGRTAAQLAEEIEKLGATVGAGSGTDAAYVVAAGLKRVLDPVVSLFADVALRPNFAPEDVQRVQRETLTSILRERDQGPVMARLLFNEALFGAHPYGLRPRGTQQTVSRIDRDAVLASYARRFDPRRATIVVVGDVTRAELEPRLQKAFGEWKAAEGAPAPAALATPEARAAVTVTLFDRPKAAQSSIVAGWVGLERTNADYVPAQVMNAIFGGMFNSRLNMNLREDKHWSYGARSGFDARRVPGPYVASAEVQSDRTADALAEVLKEIEKLRSAPPTAEELEAAKSSLVRSLPQRFETIDGVAGSVAEVLLYGLAPDYWETYDEKVLAVTAEQVQAMAKKYLAPERLTLVVAGDLATIRTPLEQLKLAPELVVRDAEGRAQ